MINIKVCLFIVSLFINKPNKFPKPSFWDKCVGKETFPVPLEYSKLSAKETDFRGKRELKETKKQETK